ncbi:pyridoxamine 5'-phosphate oxidase family protein [Streptomyces sp. APSN-46.1]|uniref:helix-turn-helix domain-containing protein n=1 Tax=Streptomyces sp. APSN-46.1 TaxID=2929049 RepID=UPI001FB3DD48|nr:pyridoxamine 5'-phosphate oxidase family protein [Streptomyces sp. APSN-46.1]MCJ1676207.1 pyridoxamine 5'-phosphate oxidase family protein [Streptomyces sp. APSN-46.1]
MSENPLRGPAAPGPKGRAGDIGRRVAARRKQLGLTREEIAARAGCAPTYIQYVEERAATHDISFLLRLAEALKTTVMELTGGTVDLPPGIGKAPYHPEFVELDIDECRSLLGTHGVGRVSVNTSQGPAILPVNYFISEGEVAFRTAPHALPAAAAGHETAFEVDHVDDALSQGWSVLVVGEARTVTAPDAVRRLEEQAYSTPWAGGDRDLWVVITPARVTGRRIIARQTHVPPSGEGSAQE